MNNDEVNLDDFCFIAVFEEGYNIRNLIEYLKTTSTTGNFVFSKDKISYREMDTDQHICIDIAINTSLIKSYKFNSDADVLVGVQLSDLRVGTKQIGKKDHCCIYMKKEIVNSYLYIKPISTEPKGYKSTTHFVKTINIDPNYLDLPSYEQTEGRPNAQSALIQFTRACKNVSSIKADHILVKAYPGGIRFTSYIEGQINGIDETFGVCHCTDSTNMDNNKYPDFNKLLSELNQDNQADSLDLPTIRVKSSVFKSLGKINNTSVGGSVTFHMERNKPLKIKCPIGGCGVLSIYIDDMER